jgi:hypothetical protein
MTGLGLWDWNALLDDIIGKIGDIFMSTDDLKYCIVFQPVCGGWRRPTPKHVMTNECITLEHSTSLDDLIDDSAITSLQIPKVIRLEMKIPKVICTCFFDIYKK